MTEPRPLFSTQRVYRRTRIAALRPQDARRACRAESGPGKSGVSSSRPPRRAARRSIMCCSLGRRASARRRWRRSSRGELGVASAPPPGRSSPRRAISQHCSPTSTKATCSSSTRFSASIRRSRKSSPGHGRPRAGHHDRRSGHPPARRGSTCRTSPWLAPPRARVFMDDARCATAGHPCAARISTASRNLGVVDRARPRRSSPRPIAPRWLHRYRRCSASAAHRGAIVARAISPMPPGTISSMRLADGALSSVRSRPAGAGRDGPALSG